MSCSLYTEDMSEEKELLGKQIRAAREARGLIQEDLAAGIGVNIKSVQRWERGVNAPGSLRLRSIIKFFQGKRDLPDLAVLEAAQEAAEAVLSEDSDDQYSERERQAMDLIVRFHAHPDLFDIWLRDGAALLGDRV